LADTPASRLAAAIACLALAVGSFGPWHTSVAASHAGVSGAGIYTLGMAAIAGLLLLPERRWLTAVVALGLACSVLTLYEVVHVAASTREAIGEGASESIEVDWGLWLAAIASVALTVGAFLFRRELAGRPSHRTGHPPGPERLPASSVESWVRANPVLFALGALLVLGVVLRVWLSLVWSPAITGYSDSGIYFQGAYESLWSDPIRMVGYSMFLRGIHAIVPHLLAVIVAQHAMGLGAAVLFFLAVRRCGGPRGLGLAPAAVLALGGDELFFEHAALSDALFVFLIAAMLYCAVRASQDRLWWAALTGLCAGLGVWDRTVGLGLVAVICVWLAFSAGRPTRRSLTVAALSLVVALSTVGAYAVWRSSAADLPGALTSNNAWNLYGRVAPWADCDKFTPPPGTEDLCESTPASQRGYRSSEEYIYNPESPAQRLYGPPYEVPSDPKAMERMQEWSEAAIRGQPLDYLNAVWRDTLRLFSPNTASYGDLSADEMVAFMLYGHDREGTNEYVESWQSLLYPHDPAAHHGDIQPFKTWEAITRVVNIWMGLLLALCLASPWLLRGRPRAGAILFGATALVLLFFPIVSKSYDYRFTIPAFAPLVAAGALAAWGLVVKVRSGTDRFRAPS
jgi:hypothetical protein